MNKVELVGRLVREPETRRTENSSLSKFTVAVDRKFKSGDATADFISCVAFGKTAEFIEKYFNKGMRIGLAGRIQTGSYKNKEGQTVYTTDVVVEECEFVESKKAEASTPQVDKDGFMNVPDDVDELPFN